MSPTVLDGSVTWTVGTGFRQAIQAGFVSLLTAFSAANPTILRRVGTVRPFKFTEAPLFYLGDLNETIETSVGVRTRTMSGFSGWLVDQPGPVDEPNDRMNFAADVFADLFTNNPHVVSGYSLLTHTATNDTEVDDGTGLIYPALEFQFSLTKVAEGRA